MSKASNISSLAELRDRREEIAAEQKTARAGLTSTLATAPAKAKEYAIEDLALPALGIGLAAYVGYRVLRSNKREEPQQPEVSFENASARGAMAVASYQAPRDATVSPPTRAYSAVPVQRPVYSPPPASRKMSDEAVESGFKFGSLIAAGKLLIPAAQMIIGVIQNQRSKQNTESQLATAQREIVAEVEDKD